MIPYVVLGLTVDYSLVTLMVRNFRAKYIASVKDAMKFYHRTIFPRHFFNSNRARYKLEKRSETYLRKIKPRMGIGVGRFVDLILRGVSRRRMLAFATVRSGDGGDSVVLRMKAPRYFTNPYIGTLTDAKGNKQTITHQPDKAKEVSQVNAEDKAKLCAEIQRGLNARLRRKNSR